MKKYLTMFFGAAILFVPLSGCMGTEPVSIVPRTGSSVSQQAVEAQRAQTKQDVDVITDAILGVAAALDTLG